MKVYMDLCIVFASLLTAVSSATDIPICNSTNQLKINPITQVVNLNDTNIKLNCDDEPYESCVWKWQVFNASRWIDITSNLTESGIYFLSNGSLLIPTIGIHHATNYRCAIAGRSRDSALATIYLRTQLQYMNGQSSLCVDPGSNGSFSFSTIGYPVPVITLYKMGSPGQWIPVNDSRFAATVTSVSVMGAKGTDDGMYLINATNSYSTSQLTFRLNVSDFDIPMLYVVSSTVVLQRNQATSVSCSVQPSAIKGVGCGGGEVSTGLTMKWTIQGTMVTYDRTQGVYMVNQNNSIFLMFQSFQSTQIGTYICQATNLRGSYNTSVMIYVSPDPVSTPSSSVSSTGVVTILWTPATPSGPFPRTYIVYYSKLEDTKEISVVTNSTSIIIARLQQGNYRVSVVIVERVSPTFDLMSTRSGEAMFMVGDIASTGTGEEVVKTVPFKVGVASGGTLLAILVVLVVVIVVVRYNSYKHRSHQQRTWGGDEEVDPKIQDTNKYIPPAPLPVPGTSSEMFLYPEQTDSVSIDEVDPKWEYPRDLLQLSEILYDGFSTVLYKGTANGIKSDKAIDVAVKSCKDHASEDDLRALIADMELLASVGSHPNIIGLLRVCTVEGPICMVMEYMCHGDLLGFLRASRGHHGMYTVFPGKREQLPSLNLTSRDLINIATKIASGMDFLAERKVVHGSLCARNVLVGTSLDVKINLRAYDLNTDSLLKWMAPETLFDGTSTTYSDVWSFGVTMWELVTLGGTPYAEILPGDLYPQLYSGMRMARPTHCAPEVYEIMRACWDRNPIGRPIFSDMYERLDSLCLSKMSVLDLRSYDGTEYSQFDEQATVL